MERSHAKRDSGIWIWVAIVAVLAVAISAGGYYLIRGKKPDLKETTGFQPITTWTGPRVGMKLYFPTADGRHLKSETRMIKQYGGSPEQIKEVVTELIRGPLTAGLSPSFPPDARVKTVFIDKNNTAYVNFTRELQADFPGGAWTETLTIYSLTDTVTTDFPDVKQVQILIEGSVSESIGGHIDIASPFLPRQALIKED